MVLPIIPCPLCKDPHPHEYHRNRYQLFYRCPCCDLVFVPASDQVSCEREREIYLLHENSIENTGYVAMFRRALDTIWPYIPRPNSILDFGCGYEPVLQQILQADGFNCVVYDPYFFPELPNVGTFFDMVISTEAFEHFTNPAKELRLISTHLEVGSTLAVMTRLRPEDVDFATWGYATDQTHIALYSLATFEWIAKAFGYTLIHSNGRDVMVLQKVS